MENRHMEAKGDTLANATTNMDILQADIETTNNNFIYKDGTGALHTVANSGEAMAFTDITCDSVTASDMTVGRVVIVGASGLLTDDAALLYDAANNILQSDNFGSPTDTDTYINFPGSNQISFYQNALKCYAFTLNEFDIMYSADNTKYGYITIASTGLMTIASENCEGIKILPKNGLLQVDYIIRALDTSGLQLQNDGAKGININDDDTVTLHADLDIYTVAYTDYSGTSIVVGWAATPTVKIYYKKIGDTVYIWYQITGTGDGTTVSFTVPYNLKAGININMATGALQDNGSNVAVGSASLNAGSNVVTLYKSAIAAWVTTGNRNVNGMLIYEAA